MKSSFHALSWPLAFSDVRDVGASFPASFGRANARPSVVAVVHDSQLSGARHEVSS